MNNPFLNDVRIKDVFWYFWSKMKPYKATLIFCAFLAIISHVCEVYVPVYSAKIIDFVELEWIEVQEIVKMLFDLLIIIAALLLWKIISGRLEWRLVCKMEISWMRDIKEESFGYLHRHSYRFFSDNFSWSLVRKINKLSGWFESIIDIFFWTMFQLIITLPLMIIIIMKQSIVVWLVFTFFWIGYSILNIWFTKNNKKYEIQSNERDSKLTWELSDTITNSFNIISFASLKYESSRFWETLKSWKDIMLKKWTRMAVFFLWTNILITIFRVVSLWLCFRLRWKWEIPASIIILVQLYLGTFISNLSSVERIFKNLNRVLWESAEMLAILKTPHEIQDKTNKKLKIKEWKIEFQNVDFWYLTDDPIVEDLNMIIKPWEKVAIVGESWSWKTTTIKLLFRLFDLRNWKILIDGQDISQVTQDSLRSQLSMVPQDALLFHRSVRDNIAYWKPDATEKEIIAAAKMARCHDFVLNLPEWYDSLVWERGIKLSWWERQRIAIARAILENCKILVLDEATSSLDSESEFLIQAAMDEVMKNKTAIVIAHRLSTIMKMDRIIVMDEWVIVEEWTHEELIKKKWWVYHKLWSIQSWWFITPDEWDKINFQPKEEEEKDDL